MVTRMINDSTGHSQFHVAESRIDTVAVVSVCGPVDMLSAPALSDAISAALAKEPAALLVDLSQVDFLASVGMSVLIKAHEWASAVSTRCAVVADGAVTSRPMRLIGVDAILALYPTVDEALRGLR